MKAALVHSDLSIAKQRNAVCSQPWTIRAAPNATTGQIDQNESTTLQRLHSAIRPSTAASVSAQRQAASGLRLKSRNSSRCAVGAAKGIRKRSAADLSVRMQCNAMQCNAIQCSKGIPIVPQS